MIDEKREKGERERERERREKEDKREKGMNFVPMVQTTRVS